MPKKNRMNLFICEVLCELCERFFLFQEVFDETP